VTLESDREAVEVAVVMRPGRDPLRPDQGHAASEELEISEALLPEARKLGLTILGEARSLAFDDTGRMRLSEMYGMPPADDEGREIDGD